MKRLIPLKILFETSADEFAVAGNISAFELELARKTGHDKELEDILHRLTESTVGKNADRASIIAGIHIGLTLASLKFIVDELEEKEKTDQKPDDLLKMEVKTTWKQ